MDTYTPMSRLERLAAAFAMTAGSIVVAVCVIAMLLGVAP